MSRVRYLDFSLLKIKMFLGHKNVNFIKGTFPNLVPRLFPLCKDAEEFHDKDESL